MDNHPIPQDVTGFKFRIIGSITIRQFLYLLGSGIAAAILIFLIPLNLILKIPLIVLFGGVGPFFAFIPIGGRPADLMLANFFRAVFSNSLYLYHKQGANMALFPALSFAAPHQTKKGGQPAQQSKADVKRALLARTLRSSTYAPDAQETARIQDVNSMFGDSASQGGLSAPSIARPSVAAQQTANDTSPSQEVAPQSNTEQAKPAPQLVVEDNSTDTPGTDASQRGTTVVEGRGGAQAPQKAASNVAGADTQQHTQKRQVQQVSPSNSDNEGAGEVSRKEATQQKTQNTQPNTTQQAFVSQTSPSSQTPQPPAPSGGSFFDELPDRPNVILGAVRDPRGKMLPNIIVEVEDSQDTPVRTLKTDANGKFASATPLPNGTYTIKFEDPRKQNSFATMEVTLSGQIFEPVVATSEDARERLRQELFSGSQKAAQ